MEGELRNWERTYYVDGMHYAACEVLIEKKLIGLDNVRSMEVSMFRSKVLVEYEGLAPNAFGTSRGSMARQRRDG